MFAKIKSITEDTPKTKLYELVGIDDMALPAHTAGAHITIHIRPDSGPEILRSYSIINPPSEVGFYRIGVQREPQSRGGSAYMHDIAGVGDVVEFDGPKNYFPLATGAQEHLLVAGGIGITPILSMASHLETGGATYALHYAARSKESMPLRRQVMEVCGEHARLWFDDGDSTNGMNLQEILSAWQPGRHVYVCGPVGLIESVLDICRKNGWPESDLHFELFKNPQPAEGVIDPLYIELRRSGLTLEVRTGESILEAIVAAGVTADYDCQIGECGTCVTKVLEGKPLHRDYYLSEKERNAGRCICTCVSWAETSRLVLDL
ncbi:PDR/VanB family oxidoreductase [Paraburkholderia aspalathi]|uniref:PDR/VanB family oxidoreductase n=1 Tax=Paraburkholderia aspalathi TaxID=1324617 RepID=UPI001B101129|nr:PDR/VanB family oxidoreductase [Paraburkholderia aspalathi]CAE6840840.1 Carnitine monooxygenase reductase subunit [Paraburkholderia aspalathi]